VLAIDAAKASAWACTLTDILETGLCPSGLAGKMAGRLSWTCSAAADKVGRAFIGPFYAQQHDPTPGDVVTQLMVRAITFWLGYFLLAAPVRRGLARPRSTIRSWTDAAGHNRMLAAFVFIAGQWYWTSFQVSPALFEQLVRRSDNYIGILELWAVCMVVATFGDELAGNLWLDFIDNDGVLLSLTRGRGLGVDGTAIIGSFWHTMAALGIGFHGGRVESKSNVADGPTREYFEYVQKLEAQWRAPRLPPWV
jgi:hypothetical protein